MSDVEQLRALETEKAFLLENGKDDRARQVDDEMAKVQRRIDAAAAAAGETTAESTPRERAVNPKGRSGGRGKPTKPDDAGA